MSTASGDEYLVVDSSALLAAADVEVSQPVVAKAPVAQWPFLLVAVLAVGGLLLIGTGSLRHGLTGLVVAMGLATLLRLVLPTATAGWLTSRSRLVDAAGFALLAGALGGVTLLTMR